MTTKPRIIRSDNRARPYIFEMIKIKQQGLCKHCKQQITEHDDIVSRGHNPRYYYHKNCAQKLRIV